jgi:hypothetical protein
MNIYQRLNAARKKFHSLKLKKTGHNKFAGYDYFELGDFLIPALNCFDEAGLCAVIFFDKDIASMKIHNVDLSDRESIIITSPMGSAALKGCHEVQNIGAVETYQRRYLWVVAMEIVEHDALDAVTGSDDKTINPVKESLKGSDLSAQKKDMLEALATECIDEFNQGRQMVALKIAHSIEDNEEKIYFWDLLKTESKLRALIKANPKVQ